MYEKPELTLIGSAVNIVLGDQFEDDDNELHTQYGGVGVQGLDD